ncbi:MAG: hypothetical protein CMI53_01075 [Parcubacteria group bacterium]|nr:hypothetical protein [Parcubacteria group bacterium]|tara:strand:- start:5264 stop:7285 length:2022 start_codon:yes stop_codon:yes gene_type:complete
MDKKSAKNRIDKLVVQIDDLRKRYHVLDDPAVSDEVYDSLQQELAKLEKEFPDLKRADSPLERIGGEPLDKFVKVKHQVRQWSFNDAFSEAELFDWQERIEKLLIKNLGHKPKLEYVCEIKIDGLHIVFTYENGVLVTAATRGDGQIGEDVTKNIKTIQSVPLKLKKPANIIVEGEVWLSEKQLNLINKQRKKDGQPEFANPRNAAAGTIRQLDPKVAAKRKLDCFIYSWSGGTDKIPTNQLAKLEELKKLGFKVNQHYQVCKNLEEVISFWKTWDKKRKSEPYWIDGVVVKINSVDYRDRLGFVGKAPRSTIAFKFAAEKVTTVIENITVQVGRLGTLTPVAHLRPVKLAGTTVKRATLHNEDQIKRLGVKIGDTVVIRKAGEIIPEVVSVLTKLRTGKEKKFVMPHKCPACGSAITQKRAEKGSDSVDLFCTNKQCFAQQQRGVIHFVSKKAFNIDGLGEKIVVQLMEEGLLKTPADIFRLEKDDLVGLERFAEKSADNLLDSINQVKTITLPKFLYSLGIANVGEETAIALANKFGSLAKIKKLSDSDLESVEDIGPIVAQSIADWFSDKNNLKLLDDLASVGVDVQNQKVSIKSGPLTGRKIVVTGSLSSLSRDEAKQKIRQVGGDWVSSVSKNTDYLVVGENPGSKLQKAKDLGVKVIEEKEFLKLLK